MFAHNVPANVQCVAACSLCCRFTNSEEALALAIEQLLGYSVNITINENHIEHGKTELVMYG